VSPSSKLDSMPAAGVSRTSSSAVVVVGVSVVCAAVQQTTLAAIAEGGNLARRSWGDLSDWSFGDIHS
jgi:hypothetical protein